MKHKRRMAEPPAPPITGHSMDWLEIQGRVQGALINLEALDVSRYHQHMKAAAVHDLTRALDGLKEQTGVDRVEKAEP